SLRAVSRCFFSHGYGSHPGLHSFPTRRSSDLRAAWPIVAGAIARAVTDGGRPILILVPAPERFADELRLWLSGRPATHVFAEVRSEEHTSELQSPDHLVCRLLLEKKKIIHLK